MSRLRGTLSGLAAEVLADLKQIAVKWEAEPPPATIITDATTKPSRQRQTRLLLWAATASALILTAVIIYLWQSQSPARAKELFARGVAKAQQGDKTGAIADYTQAIAMNPSDAETYYKRANTRYDMGATEQAIQDYTQAIKVDPSHTKAIYNRGLTRHETGDKRGAVEDFTQVCD